MVKTLIQVKLRFTIFGELSLSKNVEIINNKKVINQYTDNNKGAAIYCSGGTININGGKIIKNEILAKYNYIIENATQNTNYDFSTYGAALYLCNGSKLNIENGIIDNNKCENSTEVIIKNSNMNGEISQKNCGAGIYLFNSTMNINNAKISENKSINNSKIVLQSSKINTYRNINYGNAIYIQNFSGSINNTDFDKNYSNIKSSIKIDDDSSVSNRIIGSNGNALYITCSKVNISNSNIYSTKFNEEIYINNDIKNINIEGGAIKSFESLIEIQDVKLKDNNAKRGGALFSYNSNIEANNLSVEDNTAEFGGGIYINGNNSNTSLSNIRVKNNYANVGSGGGIYAFGNIFINNNSRIYNNKSYTYGGGIMIKNQCIINKSTISDNVAEKFSGGGIRSDGQLQILNSDIINNKSSNKGFNLNFELGKCYLNNSNIKIDENEVYPISNLENRKLNSSEMNHIYNKKKEKIIEENINCNEEVNQYYFSNLDKDDIERIRNDNNKYEILNIQKDIITNFIDIYFNNKSVMNQDDFIKLLNKYFDIYDYYDYLFVNDDYLDSSYQNEVKNNLNNLINTYNNNTDIDISETTNNINELKRSIENNEQENSSYNEYYKYQKINIITEHMKYYLDKIIKCHSDEEFNNVKTNYNCDLSIPTNKDVIAYIILANDKSSIIGYNTNEIRFNENGKKDIQINIRGNIYYYNIEVNNIDKTLKTTKNNIIIDKQNILNFENDSELYILNKRIYDYKKGQKANIPGFYLNISNKEYIKFAVTDIYNKENQIKKYVRIDENNIKVRKIKEYINKNIEHNNHELKDDDIVATGDIIKYDENNEITIIVDGDISKKGNSSIIDLVRLRELLVESTYVDSEQKLASDLNYDGNINIADLIKLRKKIVGLE